MRNCNVCWCHVPLVRTAYAQCIRKTQFLMDLLPCTTPVSGLGTDPMILLMHLLARAARSRVRPSIQVQRHWINVRRVKWLRPRQLLHFDPRNGGGLPHPACIELCGQTSSCWTFNFWWRDFRWEAGFPLQRNTGTRRYWLSFITRPAYCRPQTVYSKHAADSALLLDWLFSKVLVFLFSYPSPFLLSLSWCSWTAGYCIGV